MSPSQASGSRLQVPIFVESTLAFRPSIVAVPLPVPQPFRASPTKIMIPPQAIPGSATGYAHCAIYRHCHSNSTPLARCFTCDL